MTHSELLSALADGQQPGADLAQVLLDLGTVVVKTPDEARAICVALSAIDEAPAALPCGVATPQADAPTTTLYMLASLFQRVENAETYQVLHADGIELLLRLYRSRVGASGRHRDDLLFLLKVFAMYQHPEGFSELVSAARRGLWCDDSLWEVIFGQFDEQHPLRAELLNGLREPLPRGFCAVAYLDFVNAQAIAGSVSEHPFDTPAGKALLEGWLTDGDPTRISYAHSATASLPFVSRPERDRLLALSLDHTATRVQLEAAWASARVGSSGGLKLLRRHCQDPRTSGVARAYLTELEREDSIPPETTDPGFLAQEEMCLWLSHPNEYGRPPDSVRLYDTRVLSWPPTRDERQLWLVEYRYEPSDADKDPDVGVGMVGSVTFALFGEATNALPPEDIYALHCCWELELNQDPRAPAERSVEAGRRILADS